MFLINITDFSQQTIAEVEKTLFCCCSFVFMAACEVNQFQLGVSYAIIMIYQGFDVF